MGSNRRLPASAVGRPRHDRTRPALYPDLYPAEERRRASPNKQDSECHQLSQGSTDTCPSPELHSSAEEHRNSSPAEEVPQRSQFGRGGDVFFPNKPHHSDASWRGPPPLEETRPKEFSNREDRQRGQRLFGNVTGALARDQTDIAQQTREARRKQIELRQKAKLKAETFLWESNRQRKRRTERHEMNEDSAKAFLERDAMIARHAKNLVDARYLKTITEPVLLWRPAKLRDGDEEIIRQQIEYAERTNAAEYAEFMNKYPAQMFENVEFEAGIMTGDIEPPKEKPEPVVDKGTSPNPKTASTDPYEKDADNILKIKENAGKRFLRYDDKGNEVWC